MTTKEQIVIAMEQLPEGANIEDAFERVYLLYRVEHGVAQINTGQHVSQQEAGERLARWLQ